METVILNGRPVMARKGITVSSLLRDSISFPMPCAGKGSCGKCRVKASGLLSPPDGAELEKLTRAELDAGIRLACRARILGFCRIAVEEISSMQITVDGIVPPSTARPLFSTAGAAVDIGTTTLAAVLYDKTGPVAQESMENPQRAFGADVISRIEKSLAGDREALAGAVQNAVAGLLTRMAGHSGYELSQIDTVVITGNTAMLYLLTGRDPDSLSHAPFLADWLAGETVPASAIGLPCENAIVRFPPCISAFAGADIVTAILATGMCRSQKACLLVDIGTNGEVALWKNGILYCCSTAAGPAFEGAGLSMGMQGRPGAISHVSLTDGALNVTVIGGRAPEGICGSGIIDAVSCLLQSGDLDETGRLEQEEAVLAGTVSVNQQDIRTVQLAKSAVLAGIGTMLHHAKIQAEGLDELFVAGGFGSFIDLERAVSIGLLPALPPDKFTVCGNAALTGAAMLLTDESVWREVTHLAGCALTCELSSDPYFSNSFMEGMLFNTCKGDNSI